MGCGDDAPSAGGAAASGNGGAAAQPTAQAGYAVGRVTMPDGKPITTPGASISISISGVSEAGERVSFSPAVKADGTYKQKLPAGSYTFSAGSFSTVTIPFEGKDYRLRLEPVGNDYNKNRESADGIVQDYVWKMTGEQPGSDHNINNHTNWYGGSIGLRAQTWRNDISKAPPMLPDGTKIVFTLKPTTATTIDGAPAKTLTLERQFNARWNQCDALNAIPPAFYELSGEAVLADGTKKPLLFEVEYAKFQPMMPIRFEPDMTMNNVTSVNTGWVVE